MQTVAQQVPRRHYGVMLRVIAYHKTEVHELRLKTGQDFVSCKIDFKNALYVIALLVAYNAISVSVHFRKYWVHPLTNRRYFRRALFITYEFKTCRKKKTASNLYIIIIQVTDSFIITK